MNLVHVFETGRSLASFLHQSTSNPQNLATGRWIGRMATDPSVPISHLQNFGIFVELESCLFPLEEPFTIMMKLE